MFELIEKLKLSLVNPVFQRKLRPYFLRIVPLNKKRQNCSSYLDCPRQLS